MSMSPLLVLLVIPCLLYVGEGFTPSRAGASPAPTCLLWPCPEAGGFGELLEQLALALRKRLRDHDADLREEISFIAASLGETPAAQADLSTCGRARRDFDPHGTVERLNLGLGAEGGLPRGDRHGGLEVGSVHLVARVGLDLDLEIEVARLAAVHAGLALSGEPDALARPHPLGNADRQGLALSGVGVREHDLPL